MNTEQEVLKPCPFCDDGTPAMGSHVNGKIAVFCTNFWCHASSGWFKTEAEAIAAWNRRSSDEQAEVVAWQWQQCKSLQPGVWPEQWNNIELRPGEDRTQYWRDLAARIPDEVRVRPLYASPPAVAAGGVTAIGGQSLARIAELATMVKAIYAGEKSPRTSELLEVAQVLAALAGIREGAEAIAALHRIEDYTASAINIGDGGTALIMLKAIHDLAKMYGTTPSRGEGE